MEAGTGRLVTEVDGKTFVNGVECDKLHFVPSLDVNDVVKKAELVDINADGTVDECGLNDTVNAFIELPDRGAVYKACFVSLKRLSSFVSKILRGQENCKLKYLGDEDDSKVIVLEIKAVDEDDPSVADFVRWRNSGG